MKMNVCLYVPYRIVNYAFDYFIVFNKVVGKAFRQMAPLKIELIIIIIHFKCIGSCADHTNTRYFSLDHF